MRRWNRREREQAARLLIWDAFIDIRYHARGAKGREDPVAALERIAWLSDTCHNLAGVAGQRPPRRGELDPFVGPWKSSNPDQHAWMASVLKSGGLDTAWLDAMPVSYPPNDPVERPRLARKGIRVPRGLREYAQVNTAILRRLLEDAEAHGSRSEMPPWPKLVHAAADGRHLLRVVRRGERTVIGTAPDGMAVYRCLLQMDDGRVAVTRFHLRPQTVAGAPRRMSLFRQLWLAASVPQRRERDHYLWTREHQADSPECPVCAGVRMAP